MMEAGCQESGASFLSRLWQLAPDLNACGNAVAAKRISIPNPRERQLAFTALLFGGDNGTNI